MNLIKRIFYGNKINNLLSVSQEHYEDENYFSAIAFLTQVLDLDSKNEEALYLRAKSHLEVNKIEEAKIDLLKLEKVNPEFHILLNKLLAKIFLHEGNDKKAIEYADKFIEASEDDCNVKYFTARTKFFAGDYDEALKITDFLLSFKCTDSNLFYLRSLILFEQNNYISALNNIDHAVELDSLNGSLFNLRGLINIQLLNYEEAIDDFDYALRLQPSNAIYYFNRAKLQFKIGDLIDGIESIKNAIALDPENKSYILLRAEFNLNAENYYEALNDLVHALELDKNDTDLLRSIIDLKIYLREFDEAKNNLKELFEIEKDNYQNYYKMAILELRTGNNKNSMSWLIEAIKIKPDFKDAILKKGIVEFWERNFEEATKLFDEYLNLNPEDDRVRVFKAHSLVSSNKVNEAADELLKINEGNRTKEYFLLVSKINLLLNKTVDAELNIDSFIEKNDFDESVYLIKNVLQLENNNLENMQKLSDFQFDEENKKNAQILNALLSFEKGQYNSVKYRLSNISYLNIEEQELLNPILEYAEGQIS